MQSSSCGAFFPKGRSEQAVPPAACQLRPSNDLKGEGQGGRVGSVCGRCDRTEGVGRFRWANDIAPRQHGRVHRSIGFVRRKGQGSSNRRDDPFVSRYLRLDVRMATLRLLLLMACENSGWMSSVADLSSTQENLRSRSRKPQTKEMIQQDSHYHLHSIYLQEYSGSDDFALLH